MPLAPGYSRQAVSGNIARLIAEGYAQAQAVAIAFNEGRKAYRIAHPRAPYPAHLRARANPIRQQSRLYSGFMERPVSAVKTVRVPPLPKKVLAIGEVVEITYASDRAGTLAHYRHVFKKQARPLLVSSSDGQQLLMIGGSFRFTKRGIVDR